MLLFFFKEATKTVHLAAHAPKELFTSNTKKSFQVY
jgi:hypothetical protein